MKGAGTGTQMGRGLPTLTAALEGEYEQPPRRIDPVLTGSELSATLDRRNTN
jgi:hypothetical protein